MKKSAILATALALVLLLAVAVPAVVSQSSLATPANGWFWGPPLTCAQVFSGQYDNRVVVVEGQVGDLVYAPWNIYLFSDGTATINANFYDAVPAAAIPKGSTVRIIGEVDNGEVDVYGLQTLGTTSVEANATVAQINAGDFDEQEVVVEGQIGEKDPVKPPNWNYYRFADGTGTVLMDLEDELSAGQIPRDRSILVYGKAENHSGTREIDAGLMFLAAGEAPTNNPPNTPSNPSPADGATDQNLDVTLSWTGGDPDPGDTVTYDVFFAAGDPTPETRICDDAATASCDPGTLNEGEQYHWYVVATDNQGASTTGPTWDFATKSAPSEKHLVQLPLIVRGFPPPTPQPGDWIWDPVTQVSQVLAGNKDDLIVVVEGKITELIDTYPPVYQNYWFTDGGGRVEVDFEDYIPTAAIPIDTTVRIIGDVVENNGYRKIDVDGMQTQGTVSVGASATVAQIKNGDYPDETNVSLKGTFGDLVDDPWNVYEFTDSTGTIDADLENKLIDSQVPRQRTVLLYGQAEQNFGGWKIDAGLMLVAAGYGK